MSQATQSKKWCKDQANRIGDRAYSLMTQHGYDRRDAVVEAIRRSDLDFTDQGIVISFNRHGPGKDEKEYGRLKDAAREEFDDVDYAALSATYRLMKMVGRRVDFREGKAN